jgi:MATE family multidrug resistance protein
MALQLGGLALKVPLSLALVSGVPALGIPALGVVGCGIATALAMWAQTLAAAVLLGRDPFYRRFDLMAPDVRLPIVEPSAASKAAVDDGLAHAGLV